MPAPMPVPPNPTVIAPKLPASGGVNAAAPEVFKYHLGFALGKHVKFSFTSSAPINVGVYGPNPPQLDGAHGRMRAPSGQRDAITGSCEGNYKPGDYYVVVRSGVDGAPAGKYTLQVEESMWRVFGDEAKGAEESQPES